MQKAKVYFYDKVNDLKTGLNKIFELIASEVDDPKEKIGIKIHFGAQNNDTHVDPSLLKDITKIFEQPIFVESNCLYPGRRHRRDEHINIAREHGFDYLDIDILDGEMGEDYIEVEIDTKNTEKAKMSRGLARYQNLISVAHFKGHIAAGFGGALKNLGMGLGSRGGKMDMHAGVSPKADPEKCTACGACVEECSAGAITIEEYAVIDPEKCIGCAICIGVCPERIIRVPMRARSTEVFLEKIAEYAYAGTQEKNWWYINVLTNITMKCDCMRIKQEPFMEDIGLLFSKDPIAIDQASMDLVIKNNNGKDPFAVNNPISQHILTYGEEIGLGTTQYDLINL